MKEDLELRTIIAELQLAQLSLRKMRQNHQLQKLIHKRNHFRSYVA
jgi:hypothetical protein